MSIKSSIHRYFLIVEKIQRSPFPSLDTISLYLAEQGFEISNRTLQRDIEALRIEFNIDLSYNRFERGYFIDRMNSETESAIRFLEVATESEIVLESFKDIKRTMSEVIFENTGALSGIGHLRSLLFAVRSKRVIEFDHENFNTEERKHFVARPYLLKEYQGRWYIYAKIDNIRNPLFFGIDRIDNLVVTDVIFEPENINTKLLDNVVGISLSNEPAIDIILRFTPLQGKYIKALPIHGSQVILEDEDSYLTVRLHIVPNYELKQKILMYGDTVLVVEPAELAKEIEEIHLNSTKLYSLRHSLS